MVRPVASKNRRSRWGQWPLLCCLGLGATLSPVLAQAPDAKSASKPTEPTEKKLSTVAVETAPKPSMTLAECLNHGRTNQATVKVAHTGLNSAVAGQRALENLSPFTGLLSPDLPIRKQQAIRGVTVAQADICKAEIENTYDITYTYYSYIYARQQEITANNVIEQMQVFYETAKNLLDSGADLGNGKKISQFSIYAIEDAITFVKKGRVDAHNKQFVALAALKQAMGMDQDADFIPRETELPEMGGSITQDRVVELAITRRPELAMAAAGVDVFRLEVCAQDKVRYRSTVPTLASGTDLHSRLIPLPVRNGEYRPGGIAPDMPTQLVGKREDRVAKALQYSLKQDEVYEASRELIRLEAINAYLEWKTTSEKLVLSKERFERGKKMVDLSRENAQNIKEYDLLVRNEAIAAQAQSEYLTAVFDHIKSLARLERVTAGGIAPAFPTK
ncbi:MAG: TolC family protein [Gemmataceae bacterium]